MGMGRLGTDLRGPRRRRPSAGRAGRRRAVGHDPAPAQRGRHARPRSPSAWSEEGLGSPAVVVVGPVAGLAPSIAWRDGPLLGRQRGRHPRARPGERPVGAPARPRRGGGRAARDPHRARCRRRPTTRAVLADGRRLPADRADERQRRRRALRRASRTRGRDARAHLGAGAPSWRSARPRPSASRAHGVRADLVPERFVAEGILESLEGRPLEGRPHAGRPRPRRPPGAGRRAARPRRAGRRGRALRGRARARRPAAAARPRSAPTTSPSRRRRPSAPSWGCSAPDERAALRDGPRVVVDRPGHQRHRPRGGPRGARRGRRAHDPRAGRGPRWRTPPRPVIALLTDFGAGSEHVGALHAVMAVGCPGADRIDLAHDLPPGDIRAGALMLARLAPLAPGAVHLAVVDPGVGTRPPRRGGRRWRAEAPSSGPTTGCWGRPRRALGAREAVALTPPAEGAGDLPRPRPASPRRRRGSPAARALGDLGEPFDPADLVSPDLPPAEVGKGHLRAPVVGIDRFGNVQLLAGARRPGRARASTAGDRIFAAVTDRRHPATVGARLRRRRAEGDAGPRRLARHGGPGRERRERGASASARARQDRQPGALAPEVSRPAIAAATRSAAPASCTRKSDGSTSSSSSTTGAPAASGTRLTRA